MPSEMTSKVGPHFLKHVMRATARPKPHGYLRSASESSAKTRSAIIAPSTSAGEASTSSLEASSSSLEAPKARGLLRESRRGIKFNFPRRSVVVRQSELRTSKGSRTSLRRVTYNRKAVPDFRHMGIVESAGHRTRSGRWVKARRVLGGPRWKAGTPGVGMRKIRGWVHPFNRVKQWYIGPGDSVRILVGTPDVKYNDATVGKASGYKIYKVASVDRQRNKVFLKGLEGRKQGVKIEKPAEYEDWPLEEKRNWLREHTLPGTIRSIQLSNLSLLVEENLEDPSQHVWSTRTKTTTPVFDQEEGRWKWERYAVAVTQTPVHTPNAGKAWDRRSRNLFPRPSEKWYPIPWPRSDINTSVAPAKGGLAVAVAKYKVSSERVEPVEAEELLSVPAVSEIVPNSLNAPLTRNQVISNVYLSSQDSDPSYAAKIDALMPFYLSEELSPRFAQHRMRDSYAIRISNREVERKAYIEAAVKTWKENGRDRFLREIMDTDEAGLRGVPIQPRTEREIREVADIEWQQQQMKKLADVARKLKKGYQWNYEAGGGWIAGPRAQKVLDKRASKIRKAQRIKEYLENLKLKPAKNQFVPEEARKEVEIKQVKSKKKKTQKPIVRMDDVFAKYLKA